MQSSSKSISCHFLLLFNIVEEDFEVKEMLLLWWFLHLCIKEMSPGIGQSSWFLFYCLILRKLILQIPVFLISGYVFLHHWNLLLLLIFISCVSSVLEESCKFSSKSAFLALHIIQQHHFLPLVLFPWILEAHPQRCIGHTFDLSFRLIKAAFAGPDNHLSYIIILVSLQSFFHFWLPEPSDDFCL